MICILANLYKHMGMYIPHIYVHGFSSCDLGHFDHKMYHGAERAHLVPQPSGGLSFLLMAFMLPLSSVASLLWEKPTRDLTQLPCHSVSVPPFSDLIGAN